MRYKTTIMNSIVMFSCLFLIAISSVSCNKHRKQRSIVFPLRSLEGVFIAIAVPVDLPDQNVFVSYNLEANYYLPYNSSELGDDMTLFAPVTDVARSLNRKLAYTILEDKFRQSGFSGKSCLLRSICEAAETPLDHQGVLGGIMHVIFTPSSSKDEELPLSYYLAEKRGKEGDCKDYKKECPSGLFDVITKVIHYLHSDKKT